MFIDETRAFRKINPSHLLIIKAVYRLHQNPQSSVLVAYACAILLNLYCSVRPVPVGGAWYYRRGTIRVRAH